MAEIDFIESSINRYVNYLEFQKGESGNSKRINYEDLVKLGKAFLTGSRGSGKTGLLYHLRNRILNPYESVFFSQFNLSLSSLNDLKKQMFNLKSPSAILIDDFNIDAADTPLIEEFLNLIHGAFIHFVFISIDNDSLLAIRKMNDFGKLNQFAWIRIDKINIENFDNDPEIDIAFKQFKGNYWLAGAKWDDIDKSQEFYEKGIWENGDKDRYEKLVNSVNKGDLVFIKSAYQAGGTSYLRIKAIGRVTHNPKDGTLLKVDWKIRNLKGKDIPDLGKYRRTFARIMPDDINEVLIQIGKKTIKEAGLLDNQSIAPTNVTARLDISEKLKNKGGKIRNDVIYDEGPFDIINHSFIFTLFPKGDFWRFGVRFSKTETVEFDLNSPKRHDNPEYHDLHLSAGHRTTGKWVDPNILELIQYHFQQNDPILKRFTTYENQSAVEFQFNYDSEKQVFSISLKIASNEEYRTFLKLDGYRYFKIFAWADDIDFEIDFISEMLKLSGDNDIVPLISGNASKIATMISDSDKGEDYLELSNDVTAFSKIMASKSFQPPLAIALFGKWGSGKSFFMNKLKEKITEISLADNNSTYCKGIAQIHFNAWSYLDANLWASIVTKIFDGLNDFIKNKSIKDSIKDEIKKELVEKLTITKEEQDYFRKQKEETENKVENLTKEKNELEGELNKKIETIRGKKLTDLIKEVDDKFKASKRIENAIDSNESITLAKNEFEKIIPEKYWNNPIAAYEEAKSAHVFIKEFFRTDRLATNILWILLIANVIVGVPILVKVITGYFSTVTIIVPQFIVLLIPVWVRLQNTYKKLQPIISSIWNIKEDYEKLIKNAVFENEQQEKALNIEIEQSKKKIEILIKQIQDNSEIINGLDFKINNALSTEALYSFIDRRSGSDDYKKHLGIVSFIRRDFEILSELFNESSSEYSKFREKFQGQALERIVLYIDDLDRCPEERVIQVLESVNLLMAFPLFIVVVGVDQRWVKNALLKQHQLQFTGYLNGQGKIEEIEKIEASNYLEKIFQVPFHLKEASDTNVKSMLKKLGTPRLQRKDEPEVYDIGHFNEIVNDKPSSQKSNEVGSMGGTTKTQIIQPVISAKEKSSDIHEYLKLSDREIELMQELSGVIGTNPRSIKRFINVYQIARAHEGFTYKKEFEDKEFLILMFLLAIPMGPFHKITQDIYSFFTYNLAHATLSSHIAEYKSGVVKINEDNVKIDDKIISDYNNLNQILSKTSVFNLLLKFTPEECKDHLKFIKRFTFEDAF